MAGFTNYVPRRTLVVWLLLIALTFGTGTLAVSTLMGPAALTGVVLAIALLKVRLIGSDFMELRHAPRALAGAFDAFLALVYLGLIGMYLAM